MSGNDSKEIVIFAPTDRDAALVTAILQRESIACRVVHKVEDISEVRELLDCVSFASHELKTPLTSLKLQTPLNQRLIKAGDPSVFEPPKTLRLVEVTSKQVDRLSSLIEDLLNISMWKVRWSRTRVSSSPCSEVRNAS